MQDRSNNQSAHFQFDESDIIRTDSKVECDQWRLLRRLHVPERFNNSQDGSIKHAAVVDVETTGLSTEKDEVVQLAILPFDYEPESGRILTVHKGDAFEGMREPAVPISEEARLVHGITDEMVVGKSIDEAAVSAIIGDLDLVFAHKANFDRPMTEKHWSCFEGKPWACTLGGVDWLREGFTAGKLDYLGMQYGWFYEGHRALADCEACLALLAQELPLSKKRVMTAVRVDALRKQYLVRAVDSPFEQKDVLKGRGYRWRTPELRNGKVWWTMTTDPEAEIEWLRTEVYHRDASIPVRSVTVLERYSERIWDF